MNEPTPRRLPQVGERWKTRSGVITMQLERRASKSYPLGAFCTDGMYRTWDDNGCYFDDGASSVNDIIELVTENEKSFYQYLCLHDPRNPLCSTLYLPGDEAPALSDNCACDNCHYGRNKLALVIIDLLGTQS